MFKLKFESVMNYDAKRCLNDKKKLINNVSHPIMLNSAKAKQNMNVTVEYLGYIKQTLNAQQAESIMLDDKATVHDLLVRLAARHGEPFTKAVYDPQDVDMKPHHILAINSIILNERDNLNTKLKDGDRISVMPVVTGG